jgi:hypothetical protein
MLFDKARQDNAQGQRMSEETPKEKAARLKKAHAKKNGSLPIQLMESDLYDWNPGARYLLMIIALGLRTNENAYIPDDMPDEYKADKCLGWCDMSQGRLAVRCGKSESQVQKDIAMFRKDGVVQARCWIDSNKAQHLMYRIVGDVVKDHKRPSQDANDPLRPRRYKTPNSNRGHFSKQNQPVRAMAVAAGVNEDGV